MKQLNRKYRYNMRAIAKTLLTIAVMFLISGQAAAKKEIEVDHNARYYASRAQNYEDAGAWDAAKREIDEGLKLYPSDPDLRYLNGRYYYRAQGDLTQARYNLIKAIQENDQHYFAKRVLVDVEEESKHYSSAICYINELLEFQPYDRDLWRRKITLYRKIGQKAEADQALERLSQIYPNDSVVRRDLNAVRFENWNNRVNSRSTTEGAAKELEAMIDSDPYELTYYLELIANYSKQGQYERAIGTANRGLSYLPGNAQLVQKAAAIMGEMGDYTRAMAFLKSHHNTGPLYNYYMRMAADEARWNDPYEANARVYAKTKDKDALTYLLNTSLVRGYYPDAKEYLQESYKRYGRTAGLLMKEYSLEKRFGNQEACLKLLEELYAKTPHDTDILNDYAQLMIALANHDMQTEQWGDAYNRLEKVLSIITPQDEFWPGVISKEIVVLGHMNRVGLAREVYLKASEEMPVYRDRFAYAYEELAAARLKKLVENEEYELALKDAQDLLAVVPESEAGLRIAINMSQTLKKNELFFHYADLGYRSFPDSPYFIVKQAIALDEQGKTKEALELLNPDKYKNNEYINPQLLNAYNGLTYEYANMLLKHQNGKEAMIYIDRGLQYDPENKELLYMKGRAYEVMRDYDKAYQYLSRYYNPTNAEQEEWEEQMRWMRWRSYKNHVDFTYMGAFFSTSNDELSTIAHMYSIANIAYSHLFKNNTLTFQLGYKGVDGMTDRSGWIEGGGGMEFMAQWDHVFNKRWSAMINGSYATRYFNKAGANIAAYLNCGRGWTAGLKLGWRLTAPTFIYSTMEPPIVYNYQRYNLFMASPSVEKAWNRIRLSANADVVGMSSGIYFNGGLKGKLFINEDNISSVSVFASAGTFPELNFFDQTALSSISHSNAAIGAEFMYLFTKHFAFSVSGAWNTDYNPRRMKDDTFVSSYRNVFSVFVGLHTAF